MLNSQNLYRKAKMNHVCCGLVFDGIAQNRGNQANINQYRLKLDGQKAKELARKLNGRNGHPVHCAHNFMPINF
eukprot:1154522-Pelagomonas_calceolata.AAC.1